MAGRRPDTRLRALFLNEGLGGHDTLHLGIEAALAERDDVAAEFVRIPPAGLLRRAVRTSVPGLRDLDLDLSPVRAQLAQSARARALLRHAVESADVVHVYSQHAALLSIDLLRAHASVVSTDSTSFQNSLQLPFRPSTRFSELNAKVIAPLERRVFSAADLVVAQSDWAAASLRARVGVPAEKLRVIPFGIMPLDVPVHRHHSRLAQVTFVGTTLARKGGDRLLRVYRDQLVGRCELNLVTRDRVPDQPGVRSFHDFRPGDPRLLDLLATTDVFALPSEIDKSPYSILEAMAAGVPVIATRVGAMPELVEDGVTGFVIEPTDAELAHAIERLLADPAARRSMGEAARERFCARFDARVTTAQLVDVLDEAIRRHASDGPADGVRGNVGARLAGGGAALRAIAGYPSITPAAVVLAYHDITDDPRAVYSVPPALFRRQLETARDLGLRFVDTRELVDRLARGEPVDGLVALTFDDALVGVHRHALRVITDLDVPATVFVVTGVRGSEPPWWPEADRTLTETQLLDLRAAGIRLGSHTVSHPDLTGLPADHVAAELLESRAALEDLVGEPIDLLAYPFGRNDPIVRATAASTGYRAAFTFTNGRVAPGADLFGLPRVTMWSGQTRLRLTYHLLRSAKSWPDQVSDLAV